jgi:formylglycine-generating enzyme required for sulfatase activity
MSTLFISHSSSDNEAARDLEKQLDVQGHRSVFLDLDPEKGIVAGQSWERTLYAKLRACRAVIVLCTDHYLVSQWCFAEVALARMEGKHIFTIVMDPFDKQTQLPSILAEQQYIDLRGNKEEGLQTLWRGFKEKGIEASEARDWSHKDPPYPGLLVFEEKDAAIFFGREQETAEGVELLNRLRRTGHPRLVMVLGASGSGKSSLVRAGLLPRLRRNTAEWLVVDPFRPGREPVVALAMTLSRAFEQQGQSLPWHTILEQLQPATKTAAAAVEHRDVGLVPRALAGDVLPALLSDLLQRSGHTQARVLLVIDQFEELLGHDDARHAANLFMTLLNAALDNEQSQILVLASMRSDYLDILQHNHAFQGVAFKNLVLGPLSQQGMRAVIEQPATLGAIELEKGLTERLIADTGTSDALPLLAFTLRLLWDRSHDGRRLAIREYQDLGGLQGAIAKEADAVLEGALRLGHEEDLRNAFLKLARLTEDGLSFARQPVRWDDLPEGAHPMLRYFVDHRLLLSRGDGTVEVTHEALFRSWGRLRDWLEESREFLRWRRRLQEARKEWEGTDRDPDALLRGQRLKDARRWTKKPPLTLSALEIQFIQASDEQLRLEQRRRTFTIAVPVLMFFVVAGYLGWTVSEGTSLDVGVKVFLARHTGYTPVPEMLPVKAGAFVMGSAEGPVTGKNEMPQHTVVIAKPFLLAKYETTFSDYEVFARVTGGYMPPDSGWGRGRMPVTHVTFQAAQAYAAWLSQRTKKRYRLPTEAEWEYAARAGTSTNYWWGDGRATWRANCDYCGVGGGVDSNDMPKMPDTNVILRSGQQPVLVGSFQPNGFGFYDMAGNVSEWVQDCYHAGYGGAPSDGSAWEEQGGRCSLGHVIRGGSFRDRPDKLRSAYRDSIDTDDPASMGENNAMGFRLAQDL